MLAFDISPVQTKDNQMNNFFLLSASTLLAITFAFPWGSNPSPSEPTATVTIVHDEVEVEYLPPVTIQVVDAEVEIEYYPQG